MTADLIAAIATPYGHGGVGIVRVSGADVTRVALRLLGHLPKPRHAEYLTFRDAEGEPVDDGIALYFPAPHSFTGESILELQGHGGPVVLDQILMATVACGARLARPGEFTERAFLNGRIDLAQAEAIADLIDSSSAVACRAARQSLQGVFSRRVDALVSGLTGLRVQIESHLDFSDEDLLLDNSERLNGEIAKLLVETDRLIDDATQGAILRDGATVVLSGPPNAGKSSLLNRLAKRESAIVTDIPGTTRDVLKEQILIDGMPLHIIDTAGLRASDDPVELAGIERARAQISEADCILFIIDASSDYGSWQHEFSQLPKSRLSLVRNKMDLIASDSQAAPLDMGVPELSISVKTGAGIPELCQGIKAAAGYREASAGQFTARQRHMDALNRARTSIEAATRVSELEIMAEEMRQAQITLGEITGTVTSDDLLGEIFSSFCIGK